MSENSLVSLDLQLTINHAIIAACLSSQVRHAWTYASVQKQFTAKLFPS